MPTATVTVKDIWLPEGKKRHVLKAQDDKMYGVPPALVPQIQKGSAYSLGYKVDNWQGKQYLVVESVAPATGPAPQAAAGDSHRETKIAVLAIYKGWEGGIPVGDTAAVLHALKAATVAWEQYEEWLKQHKTKQKIEDEFGDSIPY